MLILKPNEYLTKPRLGLGRVGACLICSSAAVHDVRLKRKRCSIISSNCNEQNVNTELYRRGKAENISRIRLPGRIHRRRLQVSHTSRSAEHFSVFYCITAFALRKESSLHPPSKLLYRNLAITDFCVGVIVEPVSVIYWMSLVMERWSLCRIILAKYVTTSNTLCTVSLLTVTSISVDRLLALSLGLRYRQVVTLKRTYVAVFAFWVVSIVRAAMYFFNPRIIFWYINIIVILCLTTSVFSYTKIFLILRHNQIHALGHLFQGQPSQAISMSIARHRKAVSSALWVQIVLAVCYLPYCIIVFSTPKGGFPLSVYLARQYAHTLIYVNSSLNPLLYCWKIREIREAVKDALRQ